MTWLSFLGTARSGSHAKATICPTWPRAFFYPSPCTETENENNRTQLAMARCCWDIQPVSPNDCIGNITYWPK